MMRQKAASQEERIRALEEMIKALLPGEQSHHR